MEVIIVWILFGIVTAVAAAHKGRNPAVWFVTGLLLGPFGLILVLVMRRANSSGPQSTVLMKHCPSCSDLVRADAIKCTFCGHVMPVPKPRRETITYPSKW